MFVSRFVSLQPEKELGMPLVDLVRRFGLPVAALSAALGIAAGCPDGTEGPSATAPERNEPGEDPGRVRAAKPIAPNLPLEQPPRVAELPPADNPTVPVASTKRKPLFVGWEDPAAVLVITGRQHGYIEPCGCSGLENMQGGLNRRHTLLTELRDRGWPVAALDAGNQVRRFGRQPEIKFSRTIGALQTMGYDAIGWGPDDLRLSAAELYALVALGIDDKPIPFVSANVQIFGEGQAYRVVQVGSLKVGVTGVLGKQEAEKISGDDVQVTPAIEALDKTVPRMVAEKCDLLLLLAQASLAESRELAKKFPQFSIVASTGGAGEPAGTLEQIPGTPTQLVQVGTKSMHASVLGWFPNRDKPLAFERVPLDARFEDSPEMLAMMKIYQKELAALGLSGLGVKAKPHPSERGFIGSETCGECHSTAYDLWKETKHAHAFDTLVHPYERTEIPRHHDPECIACHVTGWNAKGYFPYETGFLSRERTPRMEHVGCESCHGPGAEHVKVESGDLEVNDATRKALRQAMQLPLADGVAERKCMECHDLDNSPAFHEPGAFERYWKKVEHKGKY